MFISWMLITLFQIILIIEQFQENYLKHYSGSVEKSSFHEGRFSALVTVEMSVID